MKLLLIGGFIGLVIGVALTVCYYALTTFFAVSAKTLKTTQNMAEIVNETAEDEKRTGRVGQGDVAFAERSHLPQKINPSKSEGVPQ